MSGRRKIRTGFVSNSSSSSFVCDICGNAESGYDASLSDFNMSSCENGHEFCNGHMTREMSDLSRAELLEYVRNGFEYMDDDNKANYLVDLEDADYPEDFMEILEDLQCDYGTSSEVPAFMCPICGFTYVNDSDLRRYLKKIHDVSATSALDEIKKAYPTRNYMTDAEYNRFVLAQIKQSRDHINDKIVKKFNHNYSDFIKFLDM